MHVRFIVLLSVVVAGLVCCRTCDNATDLQAIGHELQHDQPRARVGCSSAPNKAVLKDGEHDVFLFMLQNKLNTGKEGRQINSAHLAINSTSAAPANDPANETREEKVASEDPCNSSFPSCNDIHYAIFSMACGYSKADIAPFVETLRQTGYKGALVLGIDLHIDSQTRDFLVENNATLKTEPCQEQERTSLLTSAEDHPEQVDNSQLQIRHYMGNLNQRRWTHYLEWLNEGNYSKVWLVDSRDVIFQVHPFRYLHVGLGFFAQYTKIADWFYEKLKYCGPGQEAAEDMRHSKMLNVNGGTIGGDAHRIADFCRAMVSQIKDLHYDWPDDHNCGQNDQWLLNYHLLNSGMTREGHYEEGDVFNFFSGPALNFFDYDVRKYWWRHRDSNGTLVNKDGEPIAILHGWQDADNLTIDLHDVLYVGKREREEPGLFGSPVAVMRGVLMFLMILVLVGTTIYCGR